MGFEVERIPIEKLATIGDNFDILLFKNKNLMSKVQRLFTNSDYDHVAMLLKTGDNEIYLLEASSNVGVAVYTLNSLAKIPRYKYYQRYLSLKQLELATESTRVKEKYHRYFDFKNLSSGQSVSLINLTQCIC